MKTVKYEAQSLKTYASQKLAATYGKKHRGDAYLRTAQLDCGRFVYQFTMTVEIDENKKLFS